MDMPSVDLVRRVITLGNSARASGDEETACVAFVRLLALMVYQTNPYVWFESREDHPLVPPGANRLAICVRGLHLEIPRSRLRWDVFENVPWIVTSEDGSFRRWRDEGSDWMDELEKLDLPNPSWWLLEVDAPCELWMTSTERALFDPAYQRRRR